MIRKEQFSMNKPNYRAVVFDLDGTAVDSQYNIEALQRTCISILGHPISDYDLQLTYGMTAENAMRYLDTPPERTQEFEELWVQNILELCQNASLFEGIFPAMCRMKEAGILLGVNTSRRCDELGDLQHYIPEPFLELCDLVVTCDKVAHPKPAPDSMLYFCEETGLKLSEVLFVGDSDFDAGCAKNAGCDFALAVWGCFFPDQIDADYKPQHPLDLLSIVGVLQ